jgi:DtxR family Mn-dependent transcriptional regulator
VRRLSTADKYLEAIYRLEERGRMVRTGELARHLKVMLGTATNYTKRLDKKGLVIRKPYRGVKLTDKGRRRALSMIRKHRLSERLMVDLLGMDWSEVHEEANRFENGISEDIIKPLEKALGHPKTCPHGNPIPTKCGGVLKEESEPLLNLEVKESGTVVKITDEETALLRYIAKRGLTPGASVEVEGKTPFNGGITLKVGGKSHTVSREAASITWVRKSGNNP